MGVGAIKKRTIRDQIVVAYGFRSKIIDLLKMGYQFRANQIFP